MGNLRRSACDEFAASQDYLMRDYAAHRLHQHSLAVPATRSFEWVFRLSAWFPLLRKSRPLISPSHPRSTGVRHLPLGDALEPGPLESVGFDTAFGGSPL